MENNGAEDARIKEEALRQLKAAEEANEAHKQKTLDELARRATEEASKN